MCHYLLWTLWFRYFWNVSSPQHCCSWRKWFLPRHLHAARCSLCAGDLELDCHPFPHCVIRNFLSSETFIENLQSELLRLNFHAKSNDLYKFKQVSWHISVFTDDLTSLLMFTIFNYHTVRRLKEEEGAPHCRTEVKVYSCICPCTD